MRKIEPFGSTPHRSSTAIFSSNSRPPTARVQACTERINRPIDVKKIRTSSSHMATMLSRPSGSSCHRRLVELFAVVGRRRRRRLARVAHARPLPPQQGLHHNKEQGALLFFFKQLTTTVKDGCHHGRLFSTTTTHSRQEQNNQQLNGSNTESTTRPSSSPSDSTDEQQSSSKKIPVQPLLEGVVLDHAVNLQTVRPGDRIELPYELTVSESLPDFWFACFFDQSRVHCSTPFCRSMGLQDRVVPFALALFLTSSMSHADAAKVQGMRACAVLCARAVCAVFVRSWLVSY